MLRIRLSRTGKKRYATYRIVVAEIESPRDGRYVEQIGHYTPMTDPVTFQIDEARALHWLSVGAQPSDAVRRLLERQGTYERLARLHAGEPAAKLIAEYEGRAWPPVAPAAEQPVGIVATVSAAVAEAVETVQTAAAELVADAAEALGIADDAADDEAEEQTA